VGARFPGISWTVSYVQGDNGLWDLIFAGFRCFKILGVEYMAVTRCEVKDMAHPG